MTTATRQALSQAELQTLFGSQVTVKSADGKGTEKKPFAEVFGGKYIGVYLCRHDSPPCKKFTPHLINAYTALQADGRPFEVLFIVSDKELLALYEKEMPWAAAVGPASFRSRLCAKFNISNVPTLLMISPEGEVVAPNARGALLTDPKAFPWEGAPDPVEAFWPRLQTISAIVVLVLSALLVWFAHKYFNDDRMGNVPPAMGVRQVDPVPVQAPAGHSDLGGHPEL